MFFVDHLGFLIICRNKLALQIITICSFDIGPYFSKQFIQICFVFCQLFLIGVEYFVGFS